MPRTPGHVAFLRGINVGGARPVPMSELRELVEGLGYTDVRTLLQSGNVVFTVPGRRPAPGRVAAAVSAAIADRFGFSVDVLVRTRDELAEVVAHDPWRDVAHDRSRYLVVFLSAPADPAHVGSIDHAALEPERIAVRGAEAYLWCPDGVHRSRLPKVYEPLAAVATARNWNTVTKLLALLDAQG